MDNRQYHIRISPEVIKNDIFPVNTYAEYTDTELIPYCCDIITREVIKYVTGTTYVYSSMTEILSGGTDGTSLLTGLTVPILLTENTIDLGYYSVFDGMVTQQETMTNFLFSATTSYPYTFYFYNTSDTEFKKYLSFSNYYLDWGDGSPIQTITNTSPSYYSHTYTMNGEFTITMSGMSPWGSNIIQKTITTPYIDVPILNPQGTAYFLPAGGSWSGTPISYNYIFSGDQDCDVYLNSSYNYTTVPFPVTGYTKSTISDLEVYGKKDVLWNGKYKLGVPVTGTSGNVGTVWGEFNNGLYTAYTINNVDYYDYSDGRTVFVVMSSGMTPDMMICSAITKNEVLLNVIDEAEVQTNVFIERGKISGLERIERLGEINNIGDLEKYGYGFFNIIKIA
jgi:hypothetical protein